MLRLHEESWEGARAHAESIERYARPGRIRFPQHSNKWGITASGQDVGAVPGEAQNEGEDGTAFGNRKSAYAACKSCEDACYYYTCMYVCVILLRTPGVAKTGSDPHKNLMNTVGLMGTVKDPLPPPTYFPGGACGYA